MLSRVLLGNLNKFFKVREKCVIQPTIIHPSQPIILPITLVISIILNETKPFLVVGTAINSHFPQSNQ